MNNQKDLLAKLLATENIEVVHKSAKTASFNVETRVLTLPLWDDMQTFTYDHLVGHEVGHALFTPFEGWHDSVSDKGTGYKSFLNVVEDARIEKLIQRKYPGLRREFIKSYTKMLDDGFFGESKDAVNNYDLIDRINVYFKCGVAAGVKFTAEELVWVNEIESAETWDEVVDITDRLYGKAEEEAKEKEAQQQEMELEEAGDEYDDESDSDYDDWGDDESDTDRDGEGEAKADAEDSEDLGDAKEVQQPIMGNSPESITDQNLRENIIKEHGDQQECEAHDLFLTEKDVSDRIVPFKKVIADWVDMSECISSNRIVETDREEEASELYSKFMANNKKTINYLVKEFEMKKSADAYARATVSKTGVIDPVLMNSYKYNDDIFRKVTNVPEGKNHGMIMYLDWSGSMWQDMVATVDQTLNLVNFCRQVNIPFRVYAFTDRWGAGDWDIMTDSTRELDVNNDYSVGEMVGSTNFKLIEMFNNKMNRQQFQRMNKVLLMMAKNVYHLKHNYRLGGTPLNNTLAIAHKIEEKFQKENKVDIVNAIFLTDGSSHPIEMLYESTYDEVTTLRTRAFDYWSRSDRVFIHDTVNRKRTRVIGRQGMTKALLEAYRGRTSANIIGFRIMPNNKHHIIRELEYMGLSWSKAATMNETLKKEKYINIAGCGYDKFFGIKGGKHLETANGSFEVAEDAKKGSILSAFKKANNSKIVSRSLLNEFIKEVA